MIRNDTVNRGDLNPAGRKCVAEPFERMARVVGSCIGPLRVHLQFQLSFAGPGSRRNVYAAPALQ